MYDASDLKINPAGPEKRLLLHQGTENFLGLLAIVYEVCDPIY